MRFGYDCVCFFSKIIFLLFYRTKAYGNKSPYKGGALLAANHASFLDPPIVSAFWKQEVHFLASEYLFKIPLFSSLIRYLNSHPVQRGQADIHSIKTICQLLREGKKVVIFPEGTRSFDGKLQPIKSGAALMASKAQAAIIPIYIHGTHAIWGRKRKFPKLWGKAAIVFSKPILWQEFAHLERKEAQQALTHKLQQKLQELEAWYKAGAQGPIP